ncbi:unnamed protein product, partial [Mesorhabditis belari]|uniref:Cytochrome b561 domain-containing protein n=1 Tax=Mesorhabditis belari TaxID=2138241 RepID=A0AAF3JAD8_9BILA
MEDITFMSSIAEVALTAYAYSQMGTGFSFGLSKLNLSNHVFFMTLAHALTGRALMQFRLTRSIQDHAFRHTLAIISIGFAWFSLKQAGMAYSLSGFLMLGLQGVYILMAILTGLIVLAPQLFPDNFLGKFFPLHMWAGKTFWWLHSLQLLYTHFIVGRKTGELGCWMLCPETYQSAYHGALIMIFISAFSTYYVLTNKPPPHINLRNPVKEKL